MKDNQTVVGYLHVFFETLKIQGNSNPISANISLGEIAKVNTQAKISGSLFNEVFLIQVPKNPARFIVNCMDGQKKVAECRYDIQPFMQRQGISHTFDTDLFADDSGLKVGTAKMKITYYSAVNGKLKIRIFGLQFHPEVISQFKQAKVRVVCGIHAQSTPICPLDQPFDQQVSVLILKPSSSLVFQVVHTKGIIASFQIKNMQQAKLLCEQKKAYQVSVFNNEKAIGLIKYQVNVIK